ncbi:class I heat shock protein-like [Diospyros lotus]|uniref:class I heat shock protein-like n=1 Tax=Diospyros lotus TaxID=55363 RepID=UPI002259D488|nr:class I heat shock protein-like [Diospyros lotus]
MLTLTDWHETNTAHIFRAHDLPGVRKEEVEVVVENGNILQINGERTKEQEDSANGKWHRVERHRGSFVRRFRLPDNANLEAVKAGLVNGVLTVTVPKKETHQISRDVKYVDIN